MLLTSLLMQLANLILIYGRKLHFSICVIVTIMFWIFPLLILSTFADRYIRNPMEIQVPSFVIPEDTPPVLNDERLITLKAANGEELGRYEYQRLKCSRLIQRLHIANADNTMPLSVTLMPSDISLNMLDKVMDFCFLKNNVRVMGRLEFTRFVANSNNFMDLDFHEIQLLKELAQYMEIPELSVFLDILISLLSDEYSSVDESRKTENEQIIDHISFRLKFILVAFIILNCSIQVEQFV